MSLEHAILGFLNYEPMTGYELKKIFDLSVAHFWPAKQSHIYRLLPEMEVKGWLTVEVIPQQTRPARKVYHLTESGRAELQSWLTTGQPLPETRLAWLIQLFFAGRLNDEAVLHLLEHQANLQRSRIQRFSRLPSESESHMQGDEPPRDRFFWMLTVDFGLAQTIAQLRWLEEVIARLRRQEYELPTLR
jgi:DNA-binding PadR family transcriptional regulator